MARSSISSGALETYLAPLLLTAKLVMTLLTLSFTGSHSSIRLGILPIIIHTTWKELSSCSALPNNLQGVLAGYSVWWLLHYIDVALISRWDFETHGPTNKPKQKGDPRVVDKPLREENGRDGMWKRFKFGAFVTSNFRFPKTPFQVKSTPAFRHGDPSFVPSRIQFVAHNIVSVVFSYLVLDLLSHPTILNSLATVDQNTIPVFRRLGYISSQELATRFVVTMWSWTSMYTLQRLIYDLLALLCVESGFSSPRSWPPLFGSPMEASSIGRFWGVFWHQLHAQKLSSLSLFLVNSVLHVPHRTVVGNFLSLFVAFFALGVAHLMIDLAAGIQISESGAVSFFLLQAVAIWFEGAINAVYNTVVPRGLRIWMVENVVGYVWVVVFLTWSSPGYYYPLVIDLARTEGWSWVPHTVIDRSYTSKN